MGVLVEETTDNDITLMEDDKNHKDVTAMQIGDEGETLKEELREEDDEQGEVEGEGGNIKKVLVEETTDNDITLMRIDQNQQTNKPDVLTNMEEVYLDDNDGKKEGLLCSRESFLVSLRNIFINF